MILLKPVFIIAIVAVAMIGVMVPSVFADHIDVDSLIPDFAIRDSSYHDQNWIFRHAVDKVLKTDAYSTPDEERIGFVYIFQMDSSESAQKAWDHWEMGTEIIAVGGYNTHVYGDYTITRPNDDDYNIKYSNMYENTMYAKCKVQVRGDPDHDPYTDQLVEKSKSRVTGFSCIKHDMVFLFKSPEVLDIISEKYLLQQNPMIKDAPKINSDSVDNSLAITNNLKELASTKGISFSKPNDLEKYVKFGVSGWALSNSESKSFPYGISNVHSHEIRYAAYGSGVLVLKIQEFSTPELASKYNTMKITKKINESKYVFEEIPWKNAPNGCSMYIEYKGLDFPTAYCVVDNFRIYATSLGLIGDSELYPFVEKTVNKIRQYNVQETVVATQESSEEGGGCLIATATYGSEMATEVQQLRELRDNTLLNTESGAAFMTTFNDIYYSFSPIIADYERENPYFKEAVKIAITPMISSLSLMENAESESEVLSIGISVIMLNLGMYLGVPAIVIVGIRKQF
jgi:hypothetical protein